MQITKYKISHTKYEGSLIVVYQDNHFKSALNEFKTVLTDVQVNYILNLITDDPKLLKGTIEHNSKNRLTVDLITAPSDEPVADYAANEKIAVFCAAYKEHTGLAYKTGAAEAGKMKGLQVSPEELPILVDTFMKSGEWFLKVKSISYFVKHFNEIRALVFAKPVLKTFPLPYDEEYCTKLDFMDKQAYWKFLRANGYKYEDNGRVKKWIKGDFYESTTGK